NRENAISGCPSLANGVGASFDLAKVLLASWFGSRARPFIRQTMMPIGNFAGRKLGNSDAPKWRQDMRLGRPPCVIDRLPTASLISLNVILNRVLDAERSLPRIMPIFAPPFGPPPLSGGPLSLAIVQNHDPVSVLQIVRGADSVLGIATS